MATNKAYVTNRLMDLFQFETLDNLIPADINAKFLFSKDLDNWYTYDFTNNQWKLVSNKRLHVGNVDDESIILNNGISGADLQNMTWETEFKFLFADENYNPNFLAYAYAYSDPQNFIYIDKIDMQSLMKRIVDYLAKAYPDLFGSQSTSTQTAQNNQVTIDITNVDHKGEPEFDYSFTGNGVKDTATIISELSGPFLGKYIIVKALSQTDIDSIIFDANGKIKNSDINPRLDYIYLNEKYNLGFDPKLDSFNSQVHSKLFTGSNNIVADYKMYEDYIKVNSSELTFYIESIPDSLIGCTQIIAIPNSTQTIEYSRPDSTQNFIFNLNGFIRKYGTALYKAFEIKINGKYIDLLSIVQQNPNIFSNDRIHINNQQDMKNLLNIDFNKNNTIEFMHLPAEVKYQEMNQNSLRYFKDTETEYSIKSDFATSTGSISFYPLNYYYYYFSYNPTINMTDASIKIIDQKILKQENIIENNIQYINGVDYDAYVQNKELKQIESKSQFNGIFTFGDANYWPEIKEVTSTNSKKIPYLGATNKTNNVFGLFGDSHRYLTLWIDCTSNYSAQTIIITGLRPILSLIRNAVKTSTLGLEGIVFRRDGYYDQTTGQTSTYVIETILFFNFDTNTNEYIVNLRYANNALYSASIPNSVWTDLDFENNYELMQVAIKLDKTTQTYEVVINGVQLTLTKTRDRSTGTGTIYDIIPDMPDFYRIRVNRSPLSPQQIEVQTQLTPNTELQAKYNDLKTKLGSSLSLNVLTATV